jgi:hypothetical protein
MSTNWWMHSNWNMSHGCGAYLIKQSNSIILTVVDTAISLHNQCSKKLLWRRHLLHRADRRHWFDAQQLLYLRHPQLQILKRIRSGCSGEKSSFFCSYVSISMVCTGIGVWRFYAIFTWRCTVAFEFLVATPQTRNYRSWPFTGISVIHQWELQIITNPPFMW